MGDMASLVPKRMSTVFAHKVFTLSMYVIRYAHSTRWLSCPVLSQRCMVHVIDDYIENMKNFDVERSLFNEAVVDISWWKLLYDDT